MITILYLVFIVWGFLLMLWVASIAEAHCDELDEPWNDIDPEWFESEIADKLFDN